MKESDRIRYMWLNRHLVTVNGPYRCYSKTEAWAWVAAIAIIFIVLWMVTP